MIQFKSKCTIKPYLLILIQSEVNEYITVFLSKDARAILHDLPTFYLTFVCQVLNPYITNLGPLSATCKNFRP